MTSQDKPDFDPVALLAAPMQLVGLAMSAVETAKQTVTMMVETANSLQRSAVALEELLTRVNTMVDTLEGPARALAPEMERLGRRLHEVGDLFDGPMETLLPGLQRMTSLLRFMPSSTPDPPPPPPPPPPAPKRSVGKAKATSAKPAKGKPT
jgi:hypothetical protein